MTDAEAMSYLESIADWTDSRGDCGKVSNRSLARTFGWSERRVRMFMQAAHMDGIIRKQARRNGTHIIILKRNTKPETAPGDLVGIDVASRVLVRIVSHVFDTPAHQIDSGRKRIKRRGKPSRPKEQQLAIHAWFYSMSVIAGFQADTVAKQTGYYRRAIQNACRSIEQKREDSTDIDGRLEVVDISYRAAIRAINEHRHTKALETA